MKISVFSQNELFARMLKLEIENMKKGENVAINEAIEGGLVILDLDSKFAADEYAPANVIGFSRNEDALEQKLIKKCDVLLHRPFLISELLEYVDRLAFGETQTNNKTVSRSRLVFMSDKLITLDGKGIRLSENESALLKVLYDNLNSPVSREELSSALSSGEGNMCDVYIFKLRKKLEGDQKLIYTVRSKGYMLKI